MSFPFKASPKDLVDYVLNRSVLFYPPEIYFNWRLEEKQGQNVMRELVSVWATAALKDVSAHAEMVKLLLLSEQNRIESLLLLHISTEALVFGAKKSSGRKCRTRQNDTGTF